MVQLEVAQTVPEAAPAVATQGNNEKSESNRADQDSQDADETNVLPSGAASGEFADNIVSTDSELISDCRNAKPEQSRQSEKELCVHRGVNSDSGDSGPVCNKADLCSRAGSSELMGAPTPGFPAHTPRPPHLFKGHLPQPDSERSDYVLVVPSFNRPQMLVERTLRIVCAQKIPLERIFVFVAEGRAPGQKQSEKARYVNALRPLGLPETQVIVGVRGIMHQRNFINKWALSRYGPLKHVVSLDDDIEGLFYKVRTGFDIHGSERGVLHELEAGGLDVWITHAAEAMRVSGSYIWSLNTSANSYFMRSDVIGTSNGMCNGYLYGYRARADEELEPCFQTATEDRERSVRFFAKDGVTLRYKMYCARTKCFKNSGGIQDDYTGSLGERNEQRKVDERLGHMRIQEAFPHLYDAAGHKQRKMVSTMEGRFKKLLPSRPDIRHGLTSELQPRDPGQALICRPAPVKLSKTTVTCSSVSSGSKAGIGSKAVRKLLLEHAYATQRKAPTKAEASYEDEKASGQGVHAEVKAGVSPRPALPASSSNKKILHASGQVCAASSSNTTSVGAEPTGGHPSMAATPTERTASRKNVYTQNGGRSGHTASTSEPESCPWRCEFCAMVNKPAFLVCECCFSPRRDNVGTWRCECTCENQELAPSCAACGAPRRMLGVWSCQRCTCQNKDSAPVCAACSAPRDPAQGSWDCLRCGALSPPEALTCESCGLEASENHPGSFDVHVDSDSEIEQESQQESEDRQHWTEQCDLQPTWPASSIGSPRSGIGNGVRSPGGGVAISRDMLAVSGVKRRLPPVDHPFTRARLGELVHEPRSPPLSHAIGLPASDRCREGNRGGGGGVGGGGGGTPSSRCAAAPAYLASSSSSREVPSSTWACETCTFINSRAEAPVCEVCSTPRWAGELQ